MLKQDRVFVLTKRPQQPSPQELTEARWEIAEHEMETKSFCSSVMGMGTCAVTRCFEALPNTEQAVYSVDEFYLDCTQDCPLEVGQ